MIEGGAEEGVERAKMTFLDRDITETIVVRRALLQSNISPTRFGAMQRRLLYVLFLVFKHGTSQYSCFEHLPQRNKEQRGLRDTFRLL